MFHNILEAQLKVENIVEIKDSINNTMIMERLPLKRGNLLFGCENKIDYSNGGVLVTIGIYNRP